MVDTIERALARCHFPAPGSAVDLAVSGGADSVGLTLLALEAELRPTLHHVDHHLRASSGEDAQLVRDLAADFELPVVVHDVELAPGGNLESRARAARKSALPSGVMTGHTMDDLAETQILNLLRGAGLDGLSPMVGSPTKPILGLRRAEVLAIVVGKKRPFALDETNVDLSFKRNLVRLSLMNQLAAVAERDVVPILARQAELIAEERVWLDELSKLDQLRPLAEVDCRELQTWPRARLRRWLRHHLATQPGTDDSHPPSAAEVERAVSVISGAAVAAELSGGRRLSRQHQHLALV